MADDIDVLARYLDSMQAMGFTRAEAETYFSIMYDILGHGRVEAVCWLIMKYASQKIRIKIGPYESEMRA